MLLHRQGLRRRGVAEAALSGALREIASLGGGTVEGYPEQTAIARCPGRVCTPVWFPDLSAVLATPSRVTAVPLGEARDRLSEYVAEVERTHERVTITRHGHPAAVLISADDLAAIGETLEIIGTPDAVEAIREGQTDAAAGRFADNDQVKARHGVA